MLPSFVTAILLKVLGVHEYVYLIVPMAVGFALVLAIHRFAAHCGGAAAGLVAGTIAAVVPTLVLQTTTGLWPDPPMVLCTTWGLYLLVRWAEDDRPRTLAAAAVCLSLAILLKLTALYIGVPVLYVFVKKYGGSWWRRGATWSTAATILLPPALWYLHAYRLAIEYHNSFGILSLGFSKLGRSEQFTSWKFYAVVARKIAAYHLTPLGFGAAIAGVVETAQASLRADPAGRRALAGRTGHVLLVWLASVALVTLVAAKGVQEGHYQYLLPVLPVGCVFAGLGAAWGMDRARDLATARGMPRLATAAAAFAVVAFAANAASATHRFETHDRADNFATWAKKKTTGLIVRRLTPPGSLILVVDTEMDAVTPERSMTPADVFYFSDRKGWYQSMAWLSEGRIEQFRREGADYLVVSGQSVVDFRTRAAGLYRYLEQNYASVLDDDDGIVFDMTRPVPDARAGK